jgi:hypothetical protein
MIDFSTYKFTFSSNDQKACICDELKSLFPLFLSSDGLLVKGQLTLNGMKTEAKPWF